MKYLLCILLTGAFIGCSDHNQSAHLILVGTGSVPAFDSLQVGARLNAEDIEIVDSSSEYGVIRVYFDGKKEITSTSGGFRLKRYGGKLELDGMIRVPIALLHLAGDYPSDMQLVSKSRIEPTTDLDVLMSLE